MTVEYPRMASTRKAGAEPFHEGGRTNAISALHPKGSEEKRLFEAMVLAVAR